MAIARGALPVRSCEASSVKLDRVKRTDAFLAAEFGHTVDADEAGALRERMRQAQTARRRPAPGAAA